MAPVLAQMDTLLDDEVLFQAVQADWSKRCPQTASDGRPSTPVEVILRMLVVKPLYGWSFPQTAHCVSDSWVLRQFCRVYVASVPDQSPLPRGAKLLQPATVPRVLEHLVHLACQLQGTQGRPLRLDGTVVATTIHHPPDSTLLSDGVRVLRRMLGKATTLRRERAVVTQAAAPHLAQQARAKMTQMLEVARQRGEAAAARLKTPYHDRIDVTTTVVARAKEGQEGVTAQTTAAPQRVAGTLARFIPLVEQVSTQTTRRVLQGEQGPACEQIVSLCEPDTAMIRTGTPGKPTEFGRVLWLDEVEGGLISRYAVLDGNPDEKAPLPPSLHHHCQQFGPPPPLLTGDRGRHAAANERYAQQQGVTEVVLPKPGTQSAKRLAYERPAGFRAGRNWRAGIAGRISGRKRRHGLDRGRYRGTAGMERWVGLGVIAPDLHVIAQHLAA